MAHPYRFATSARFTSGRLANGSTVKFYSDRTKATSITTWDASDVEIPLNTAYAIPATGLVEVWAAENEVYVASSAAGSTAYPLVSVMAISTPAGGAGVNVVDYGAAGDGVTDDSASIQAAIDSCGSTGGVVVFPKGAYLLGSASISLPMALTGRLVLSGYGATLKCSSASQGAIHAKRLTDLGDTWQHITIEGFDIDCDNVVCTGTGVAKIFVAVGLPSSPDGVYNTNAHVNFDDILFRDLRVYNLPVQIDGTKVYQGMAIGTVQYAVFQPDAIHNYVTNITIERCRVYGGEYGVSLTMGSEAYSQTYNVEFDNIVLRDCYHDSLTPPTIPRGAANYHIGAYAPMGRVLVSNCYGANSGDVGLEINNASHAVVENCKFVDARTANYFFRNYCETLDNDGSESFVASNCRSVVTTDVSTSGGFRFAVAPVEVVAPFGDILVEGCSFVRSSAAIPVDATEGVLIDNGADYHSFTVRDFKYRVYGGTIGEGAARRAVEIRGNGTGAGQATVILDGIYIDHEETVTAGAYTWYGIVIDGDDIVFSVRDVSVRTNITDSGAESISLWGVCVGPDATNSLNGVIERLMLRGLEPVASAIPISISSTATLTIPKFIVVKDCDFTTHPAFSNSITVGAGNAGKVRSENCAYTTVPYPEAITVTASPFTYTNTSTWSQHVTVVGGTVTPITISTDAGGTFTDVGVVAGAFLIRSGDQLRVTYSSAPTMAKIPKP